MERRRQVEERRTDRLTVPAERRAKFRRKMRKLEGSPGLERHQIDLGEEYEIGYWSKALGVSADDLKSAVQKAGPSVKAVRDYLGRQA